MQKRNIPHSHKEKKQHTDLLEEDEKEENVDERFQNLGQKILELLQKKNQRSLVHKEDES